MAGKAGWIPMIGRTLSHYRIVEKIGAGGMGEVYRATDTKLRRDVALKVLPEVFANDAQRMARFSREAQVLASLNHPNIASIYGLEESGSVRCLVLELVEGPTLAERIGQGALPLDEALDIARQIAEALEAAHDRGIIHRDLKPANVKVREDGQVKVLDFGLAKALEDPQSEEDIANSPTLSVAATQAGVILGTAAYMSPEQTKGKRADRRSDIWAFGVVLFEMLTARRLYTGETISEVLASVMKDEPDWDALPGDTPSVIRKLLARCLAKGPRRRLQAIGEARLTLEGYLTDPSASAVVLEPGDIPPAAATAPLASQTLWLRALPWALLAAMTLTALLLWAPWRAEVAPAPVRLSVNITTDDRLLMDRGPAVVLSPDGTRIAFVAITPEGWRLFVRSLDKLEANQLSGTRAHSPFFSPDGNWVGFFGGG
ncbi:MAG: protein kinase, partial [Nitrospiraceae bacterium]